MKGWTLTTISRMRLRMKTQPASAPLSVFLLWSGLRIVTVRTSREWKYLSLKNIPIVINHVWYFSKMPVVVLVGAVGLKVGPVIKFIRSDRLLLLREIFVVMDKTHCCGNIITASPELPGIRSRIIEDICIFTRSPPSTDFPEIRITELSLI